MLAAIQEQALQSTLTTIGILMSRFEGVKKIQCRMTRNEGHGRAFKENGNAKCEPTAVRCIRKRVQSAKYGLGLL